MDVPVLSAKIMAKNGKKILHWRKEMKKEKQQQQQKKETMTSGENSYMVWIKAIQNHAEYC